MSTYTDVEEVLRQIVMLRSSGASAAAIDATLDEARTVFAELPPSPFGAPVKWAPDVADLAAELGFGAPPVVSRTRTPPPLPKVAPKFPTRSHKPTQEIEPDQVEDIETAPPTPPASATPPAAPSAGTADAGNLERLASEINTAIVASGGVGNLHVACMTGRIILTGIAADEDSRDEALIAAAKLAPGIQIDDEIEIA